MGSLNVRKNGDKVSDGGQVASLLLRGKSELLRGKSELLRETNDKLC